MTGECWACESGVTSGQPVVATRKMAADAPGATPAGNHLEHRTHRPVLPKRDDPVELVDAARRESSTLSVKEGNPKPDSGVVNDRVSDLVPNFLDN